MSATFWIHVEENGTRRSVELTSEVTVGRGSTNTIAVADPRSSRNHCRVLATPQGVVLEDLGSRNGTVFKGTTVKKTLLKLGDEFRIGQACFTLRDAPVSEAEGEGEFAETGEDVDSEPSSVDSSASHVETIVEPSRLVLPLDVEHENGRVESIDVREVPFTIGRRSSNDLVIEDARSSGQHARITRDGARWILEDLESRNGTIVGDRRVRRVALVPGLTVTIGSTKLRVGGAAPEVASADDDEAEWADDAVAAPGRFDAGDFAGRGAAEHPLAVVGIVAVLGAISFFGIDLARRVLVEPTFDPVEAGNLLGTAWSFEAIQGEGEDAVPAGWTRQSPTGSFGSTTDLAQHPGRRALVVTGAGDAGTAVEIVRDEAVPVSAGTAYRLESFVGNRGPFAAGVIVHWLRTRGGTLVEFDRAYSEVARERGETLSIDQVVLAPPGAEEARIGCFVWGGGTAVFDRVSFRSVEASDDEAKPQSLVRSFTVGSDRSRITFSLTPNGRFSLRRGAQSAVSSGRVGLAPERDPAGVGTAMTGMRITREDATGLAFVAQVPDVVKRRWVTVESSIFRGPEHLTLTIRRVVDAGDDDPGDLVAYLQLPSTDLEVRLPDAGIDVTSGANDLDRLLPDDAQPELIVGRRSRQVALGFAPPSPLAIAPHAFRTRANGEPVRTWVVRSADPTEFVLSVSIASRLESSATLGLVRNAETKYQGGDVGGAIALLGRIAELYPEQEDEIALASERVATWREEADARVESIAADLAALRAAPAPILYRLIEKRSLAAETSYKGLAAGRRAREIRDESESLWRSLQEERAESELGEYYERGRALFGDERLGLARLYLEWVIEAERESDLARQATTILESIDKRRARQRASHLR